MINTGILCCSLADPSGRLEADMIFGTANRHHHHDEEKDDEDDDDGDDGDDDDDIWESQ